jgi:hypothetical protein
MKNRHCALTGCNNGPIRKADPKTDIDRAADLEPLNTLAHSSADQDAPDGRFPAEVD